MMKTITILFLPKNSERVFQKCFGEKSAFDLSVSWAENQNAEHKFIFTYNGVPVSENLQGKDFEIILRDEWKVKNLFEEIKNSVEKYEADNVLYAWGDCPFLNKKLTDEIKSVHEEFFSEYTFADGYPYGLAPEMIAGGTAKILYSLCENSDAQKSISEKEISRTSIFDFLKTDINSFEIETVLSEEDWRLYRFSFECSTKIGFNSCVELSKIINDFNISADEISKRASECEKILKVVPTFYNLQISTSANSTPIYIPKTNFSNSDNINLCFEKAKSLINQIADFSESAVICLSYFGEPFFNPDLEKIVQEILLHPGLSVFIETDGLFVSEERIINLCKISENALPRTNGYEKIMFAVSLDAATPKTFAAVRNLGESDFEKVLKSVSVISKFFPTSVYPQFVRMNENEDELESFYRFWNEKNNPSNGNLIIQKYNGFCSSLPDRKPADLSPIERNVCWHLRRDMNIFANGDVSFCHSDFENIVGNVFEKTLEEVWSRTDDEIKNQMKNKFCEKCGMCDEYYTFNF